jgi:hypothetical protein
MQTPNSQTPATRAGVITRFGRWLFCWKTARRLLVCGAVMATLIAIFYAEENWRGRRAWEQCKLELESEGEVLDWNAYIPPPVPDGQNIFKDPKMQEWFVRQSWPASSSNELSGRFTNSALGSVGTAANVITDTAAAAAFLEWSDGLSNEFALIRGALDRPYARMDGDYRRPFEMPIVNFVIIRSVAQTLAQRAHCYFLLDRSGDALHELTLLHKLRYLLEAKPTGKPMTLVSAMIQVAITGLYVNTIAEGLQMRVWKESDLVEFQRQLGSLNLPLMVGDSFRSERAAVCHTFGNLSVNELADLLTFGRSGASMWKKYSNPMFLFCAFAPRGWIDQNLAFIAYQEQNAVNAFDSTNGLIQSRLLDDAIPFMERAIQKKGRSPYTLLAGIAVPNYVKALQTTARNQTLVSQGAVACALERHRLADGQYPKTLDALVPKFMDKIPHDIIGGQPIKYQRTADGKFLLYSIGWNEKDDGGQVVRNKNGAVDVSSTEGDWVWPVAGR